jgi:outer membrane protein assembly factor BamB
VSANDFALGDSVLIAGATSFGIPAYRTSDGTQVWKHSDPALGAFTTVGNTAYIDTFRPSVLALGLATGVQQWETQFPRLDSGPIVDHDLLYMSTGRGDGAVLALKVETGEIAWQKAIAGTPGAVLLANGVLYTASSQPNNGPHPVVYAFNPSTGATVWTHDIDHNLETVLAAPDGLSGCPKC